MIITISIGLSGLAFFHLLTHALFASCSPGQQDSVSSWILCMYFPLSSALCTVSMKWLWRRSGNMARQTSPRITAFFC